MGDTSTLFDPRIGSRVAGRYRLEARLASGGMAIVYRARDEVLGRDVAVKIMHPGLAHDPNFVERFRRETQNAARLSHPNVVTVYDGGESDGDLYIVMELVDGTTLRSLLERFGRFDPPTARHVARGVAAALDHAHAKGIVHRDVKPENVLLTPGGDVKVVDFGIARALGAEAARLTTDSPIGTIAYVAPEQLTGEDADARADVFALGAVTYEMLTGRPPFRGDTPQAVAAARLNQPLLSPGIAPQIDGAVARATAQRREDRFDTPGEFARALGEDGAPTFLVQTADLPPPLPEVLEPLPDRADEGTSVLPLVTRLRNRSRRRFRIWIAIAILLAVGGATAYAVVPRPTRIPDVRGQSVDQATTALERASLKVGDIGKVFDDIAPSGTVVGTEPRAGMSVRRDTMVALRVSKGPELFRVPDVIGKPLDVAREAMTDAGFTLAEGDTRYSDSIRAGAVISLDPDVDDAKRGQAFVAVVSKGPHLVAVPTVAGKSPDSARSAIVGAGFTYGSSSAYSETVEQGKVIRTEPAGGKMAPKGSRVTAVVSKGPRPFPMPNFVGMTLREARQKAHAAGLVISHEYPVPGSKQRRGTVQGQNPPAGTSVRRGTTIDLYYAA